MRRSLTALCLSAGLVLVASPALAADTPVTPLAPTVVDECGLGQDRVKIPDVPGVQYLYEVGGIVVQLTPGDYAGVAFIPWDEVEDEDGDLLFDDEGELSLPDAQATITAEALDGAVLTPGAPTSFDVSLSSAPCASSATLVTATSDECGTLTFTNPAGNPPALVMWVDTDSLEDYTEVVVPAGTSRTVSTSATEVDWFAVDDSVWDEDLWEGELAGASPLGATVPDEVATQEDRDAMAETAEFFDSVMQEGLGGGLATVDQDCATPSVDEPSETPAPTSPAPTAPEIPAVVQTDGIGQG